MNAFGDCAQATRAVINGIHRGDHGEENLRRADVARRFVAADVLLARLQRESIAGRARPHRAKRPRAVRACGVCIDRASRNMRRAVRQSRAERRSAACCRRQHRRQIRPAVSATSARGYRRRRRQARRRLCRFNEVCVIENRAVGRGILHERAENGLVEFKLCEIADRRPRCRAASRVFARPRSFADDNCRRRKMFCDSGTTA